MLFLINWQLGIGLKSNFISQTSGLAMGFQMIKTYKNICEVRDLNPRSRAWEARTLTSLG
jgi:hypothetical protein